MFLEYATSKFQVNLTRGGYPAPEPKKRGYMIKDNLVINTCSECGAEYNRMDVSYCDEYPNGEENWANDDWYIHWTYRCPQNEENKEEYLK